MAMKTENFSLDPLDIKILSILQKNNLMPQRDIGKAVHLSAAAVQRRIKRMQESGVIMGNIAVADPLRVGSFITLLVEVILDSEQLAQIDKAKKSFIQAPEVQQCYYVTGAVDFLLVIVVASMADYEALTRKLFFDNHNVKRFNTFVSMDRVKAGLSVPL